MKRPSFREHDRGAGTAITLGVIAVLMVLATVIIVLIQAQTARGTAQTAADFAALAGAQALQLGYSPCDVVVQTVSQYQAELDDCQVMDATVRVEVTLQRKGLIGQVLAAHAAARAGPQGSP